MDVDYAKEMMTQIKNSILEQAVIAIKVKNPSSKIIAYKLQGELNLNFPVSGIEMDEITEEVGA